MIDLTLYMKNAKDKMSAEEKAYHERMTGGIIQFAAEYGVEPLALALAMQYIRGCEVRKGEREQITKELAKEINSLLPHADLDQIKILMLKRIAARK
jgi:hypothetical protein